MGKSTFENLTTIQKLQLYLIIPMIFWLLLFLFENYLIVNFKSDSLQKNSSVIDIPKNKIENMSISKIIQYIEQKAKYYKLKIQSIQSKQKTIMVEINGSYLNTLGFLQKIKLHYQIRNFEVIQEEKLTRLYITLNNEYFFNKDSMEKEFSKENIQSKSILIKVKLEAIVGNEVLIDGVWFKQGEIYKQYEIIDINNSFIKLQKKEIKQLIKVELNNESL